MKFSFISDLIMIKTHLLKKYLYYVLLFWNVLALVFTVVCCFAYCFNLWVGSFVGVLFCWMLYFFRNKLLKEIKTLDVKWLFILQELLILPFQILLGICFMNRHEFDGIGLGIYYVIIMWYFFLLLSPILLFHLFDFVLLLKKPEKIQQNEKFNLLAFLFQAIFNGLMFVIVELSFFNIV